MRKPRILGVIKMSLLFILTVMVAVLICWPMAQQAKAGDYTTRTLMIPYGGEAAMIIVFRDRKTGDLIDAAGSGEGEITTTWGDAEVAATSHAYSNDWVIRVPDTSYRLLYFTYWTTDPVDGTTAPNSTGATLYDASTGYTSSDAVPLVNGKMNIN